MRAGKPIPKFASYERLIMRALFALVVWEVTPAALIVNKIPAPNGIARLVDLQFLLDPRVFAFARIALGVALIFYVLRFAVWLALPVAFLIHVAARTILNSQGAIQHAAQIVSLVLFSQMVAHFYGLWRRRRGVDEQPQVEDRAIWWSQQAIVAVYLVAGITKLVVTKGLWPFQARWIGVSIAKAAYQSFYDTLNFADLQQQLAVANFAATHAWVVALIAALGLFLELGSPLMLINRIWAAGFGATLICFHISLSYAMHLTFPYNQWLLFIFMINVPYWIVYGMQNIVRQRAETTSP